MKFLSIITINLNNDIGLKKTIESVVNQSFSDFEYIIIDGGSLDKSIEIIKEYNDRITYWISEPDEGIYSAMNKGIHLAKGEYLLFLNSGDILIDNILLKVFLNNPTADIVYGDYLINNKNTPVFHKAYPQTVTLYSLFVSSLPHQATFHKSKLFSQIGEYNEKNKVVSDWEFFIQAIIINNCSLQKLDFPITVFDISGISENDNSKECNFQERNQVLNRLLPPRIIMDYEEMKKLKEHENSELWKWFVTIQQTSGLKQIVIVLIRFLFALYRIFKNHAYRNISYNSGI